MGLLGNFESANVKRTVIFMRIYFSEYCFFPVSGLCYFVSHPEGFHPNVHTLPSVSHWESPGDDQALRILTLGNHELLCIVIAIFCSIQDTPLIYIHLLTALLGEQRFCLRP